MVKGFDSFKKAFAGFEDSYTIIGGTACNILMDEAGLDFRATKDIDMILLIENRFEEFASVFWKYIKAGGYRCGWKSSESLHFYRYTEPVMPDYPVMIELFSSCPDYIKYSDETVLVPLHISDEVSSLSAILLNEEYYNFMMAGRKVIDGVGLLGEEYLIPFKARAWIDLTRRKSEGEHVNSDDLKKHKNDVFRLFRLIKPENKIALTDGIKSDMQKFIEAMPAEGVDMKNLGLDMKLEEALEILGDVYL